ncbi:MAG: adenylate/guanylate cyclase domain-containing protein [Desulfobacteraceae bacterium]|nr:adenylate/guanylate cyclase domain-containing protein [Desulfobacteraceae bacterium]
MMGGTKPRNTPNPAEFQLIKNKFLFIQQKYEHKINELSIIKEMVASMKSIDLTDHDRIWQSQLDCLVNYKNLSGAVLYLFKDILNQQGKIIGSSFDNRMDYSFLRQSRLLKNLITDKEEIFIDDVKNSEDFKGLEGSLYAIPMISKGDVHGALVLLKNTTQGFQAADSFFYAIVRDHLMNTISFQRFYFDKINEEKHIMNLSRFFSKNVVDKILESGRPRLGGERKNACIIFADIQGFTALSETIPPEEVVVILNDFFSHMIPIVFKHSGTLDKLMGDCVMAIFGAPMNDEKCSLHGVSAVLEMFVAFKHFKQKKGGICQQLKMTVGINTGELIAGFLGEENHLNYTVIGDTVNSAQRLQSMARGNEIYLSSNVFDEIKADIETLENIGQINQLGELTLKGKKQILDVYRIIPEIC